MAINARMRLPGNKKKAGKLAGEDRSSLRRCRSGARINPLL